MTETALYQMCRRVAEKAGVEGRFNPHAFRHLVGQTLLDQHEPVRVVQEVLGHKDPQTTYSMYHRAKPEHVRHVVRSLPEVVFGCKG